jgi:ASC-1-like (ASCH) protein
MQFAQQTYKIACEDPWFSFIRQGAKTVEGRKNTHTYKRIKADDLIIFFNGNDSFRAIVTEVRQYASLEEYLEDVTIEKALPGVTSLEQALEIYYQWSSPEKLQQYGFLGIFVKPIK